MIRTDRGSFAYFNSFCRCPHFYHVSALDLREMVLNPRLSAAQRFTVTRPMSSLSKPVHHFSFGLVTTGPSSSLPLHSLVFACRILGRLGVHLQPSLRGGSSSIDASCQTFLYLNFLSATCFNSLAECPDESHCLFSSILTCNLRPFHHFPK